MLTQGAPRRPRLHVVFSGSLLVRPSNLPAALTLNHLYKRDKTLLITIAGTVRTVMILMTTILLVKTKTYKLIMIMVATAPLAHWQEHAESLDDVKEVLEVRVFQIFSMCPGN